MTKIQYCRICKAKIYNKLPSATYCKKHSDEITYVSRYMHGVKHRQQQKYPKIKFEMRLKFG